MTDPWRRREQQDLREDRRRLGRLCAAFGVLALGGFVVASLAAVVVGAIGATLAIGLLRNLLAVERLLSVD